MLRNPSRRLSLEALEDRLALSCTVGLAGDTLTIIGDGANDTVLIRDDGQGNITGDASGLGFAASKVRYINVNTEGGNDNVRYQLDGDLAVNQFRYITVGLGSNADPSSLRDTFVANLGGHDILDGASLVVNAMSGHGNDLLVMQATDTDVGVGGRLKTTFDSGIGNDLIAQTHRGVNNGALAFRSFGYLGDDTIRQMMDVEGGTGITATIANGGDGQDSVTSLLYLPPGLAPVPGSYVDGGSGVADVANVTANLAGLTVNAETVNVW